MTIAAQCCDPSASSPCRRYTGGAFSNNDRGCIGGKPPRPTTFFEAEALCEQAGLVMCEQSCAGEGCDYNRLPVWSKLTCTAPAPTPAPTPAPALTVGEMGAVLATMQSALSAASTLWAAGGVTDAEAAAARGVGEALLALFPSAAPRWVKVLDGGKGDHPAETCVAERDANGAVTTEIDGTTIAAQCCDLSATGFRFGVASEYCRRYIGSCSETRTRNLLAASLLIGRS